MDSAILIVPLVAVVAPLLAALVRRALVVPLIVFEIGLGMLVGPSGLGWVQQTELLGALSQLGLAMLFFMAGNEIDPASVRGRSGGRALGGWAVSAVIAAAAAVFLADTVQAGAIIAIALTGTALGTITPILRDAGLNRGPLGGAIGAAGAVGEFAPLVAISVFFSGRQPLAGLLTLLLFLGAASLAFAVAAHGRRQWLRRMVSATLHTSGQFAIRFVIALLAALVALAVALGVDFLLGAFAAGMLARVVLRGGDPDEQRVIGAKLESIAFGFFVPVFFVSTGVSFPLRALLADPASLALVPVFAIVMLLARGLPGFFAPGRGSSLSDRRTAALFTATTLPLVIAAAQIGNDAGVLDERLAAALVGGGMLTVLLFPMLALVGREDRPAHEDPAAAGSPDGAAGALPAEAHE